MANSSVIHRDGKDYSVEDARIERALLGIGFDGNLILSVRFAGSSWTQSHTLENQSPAAVGSFIASLLQTLGLRSWDDLPETEVKLIHEELFGPILGIVVDGEPHFFESWVLA